LIYEERESESDHHEDLKSLVSMTIDLDLYRNGLEPVFIEATSNFYQEKSGAIRNQIVLAEYLKYCERKIKEELERMHFYMHK
jgi:hypothetical protein